MFEYFDYDYRQPPSPGMPFGQQFPPTFGPSGPPSMYPGPSDPPFGPPSGPPFGPPTAPDAQSGPPSGPPPSFTPQQGPGVFAVDPGAIRPCIFRFVYIWLNNGDQFWAWLVFVGPRSIAGWRWTGRRWVYFGVDLRNIRSFTCF
jgi:hypothetical protein